MLPPLRSHNDSVQFVNDPLESIDVPKAHQQVPEKLALLDLTPMRLLMLDLYSTHAGRPACAPEDMVRTFVAMVFCGITSPTVWVEDYLQDGSGFYAVISGVVPEDVPSVGALYPFSDRLMKLPTYCKANPIRFKRKRLSQTQKQPLKDDKQKVSKRHVGSVAKLAKRLARIQTDAQDTFVPDDEAIANALLECCCLSESQRRGLLDTAHRFVACESTQLPVHGNPYGKRVCACSDNHCDCKRYYNAPDASIAPDAHHDAFVYSHRLYQLTRCSMNHPSELPAYLLMTTGARHDSVTATFAMHRCTQRFGVDYAVFDAAHDATAFSQMAHQLWQTQVFIPLNPTNEGNYSQIPMATITPQGIPICPEGHEMYGAGYCSDRDRVKWRCPIKATQAGNSLGSECLCSSSDDGRVVYTHPQDNLRLYPKIPRHRRTWKQFYDHRTAAERVFKRQKLDFKRTGFKTRSKSRQLFYALLTALAIHVETWYHQDQNAV